MPSLKGNDGGGNILLDPVESWSHERGGRLTGAMALEGSHYLSTTPNSPKRSPNFDLSFPVQDSTVGVCREGSASRGPEQG